MDKLELLPDGEFKICISDTEIICGKMGSWSLKRLCDHFKVETYIDALGKLQTLILDDAAHFLLFPVQYKFRKNLKDFTYTLEDAYEWLDAIGGMYGENFQKLVKHGSEAIGIKLTSMELTEEGKKEMDEESKKKLLNGTISNESVMQQA